jgi:hypothetical protein
MRKIIIVMLVLAETIGSSSKEYKEKPLRSDKRTNATEIE